MGLQKTYIKPDMTSGDYWRITRFLLDIEKNRTEAVISLYRNKTIRDAGSSQMTSLGFVWELDDNPINATSSNPLKLIYEKIKTINEGTFIFSDAVDVLDSR